MIGVHRTDCGCAYCLHPVVRALDRSADEKRAAMAAKVNEQLAELHGTLPDSWFGGREITDGPKQYHYGCTHEHTTKYLDRTFCRDCGRPVE